MPGNDHTTWYTGDEKRYTRGIVGKGKKTRLEMLELYKKSIDGRKIWGSVNKEEVVRFIWTEIENEKKHTRYGGVKKVPH